MINNVMDGLLSLLDAEISPSAVLDLAADIARRNRASDAQDWSATAEVIAAHLAGGNLSGVEVQPTALPPNLRLADSPVCPGWSPQRATLDALTGPDPWRLADVSRRPETLMVGSCSTGSATGHGSDPLHPGEGDPVEAELVEFGPHSGVAPGVYRGHIVLGTATNAAEFDALVEAALVGQARGLIAEGTPGGRGGSDIQRRWLPPHAWTPDGLSRLWGFSLSANDAAFLRRRMAFDAARGQRLRLRAAVRAQRLETGPPTIAAEIPGRDPHARPVWLFAAVWNPGATDNAAGAAAAVQAMTALAGLIAQGRLPQPQRPIQLRLGDPTVVMVARLMAALAHLGQAGSNSANTAISQAVAPVAALAIRRVGLSCQAHPFTFHRSPQPTPPLADVALETLLTRRALFGPPALSSLAFDPAEAPLADPLLGISCPVLTQEAAWENIANTSADTPNLLDPQALGCAATLAAATVWQLAHANTTDIGRLAESLVAGTLRHIQAISAGAIQGMLCALAASVNSAVPVPAAGPPPHRSETRPDIRLHRPRRRLARELADLVDQARVALTRLADLAPASPLAAGPPPTPTADLDPTAIDTHAWLVTDLAARLQAAADSALEHVHHTIDREVARLCLSRGVTAAQLGISPDLPVPTSFQEHIADQLIPRRLTPGFLDGRRLRPAAAPADGSSRAASSWPSGAFRTAVPGQAAVLSGIADAPHRLWHELLWVDGRRSLLDIYRQLNLRDEHFDLTDLVELFTRLAAEGHIEFTRRGLPEYDHEGLLANLRRLGLRESSLVIIDGSLRAIGHVMGGAVAVLEALREAIGDRGTLVVPTFTTPGELYLPDYTPSYTGLLGEFVRCRAGAVRSWHPTHSVVALGPLADVLIEGHRDPQAMPLGHDSPLHRAVQRGASVLVIGGTLADSPTTLMAAHIAAKAVWPRPAGGEPSPLRTRLPDGRVRTYRHGLAATDAIAAISQQARQFAVEQLISRQLVRTGLIGGAPSQLVLGTDLLSAVGSALSDQAR